MNQTVKELHKKRMKLWDASISNHKKYIDNQNGLFRDEFVEYRKCPVCSQDNYLNIFFKEGGSYVKCLNCSMVYLNPVFTDDALNDYYEKNHSVQAQIVESGDSFYEKIYNHGLNSIEKICPPGNILDIGCSSGVFLDLSKNRGWKTNGIELNVREFKMAQMKGHSVYNSLIENTKFDKKFNAITLWDVFEHIKNGKFYLNMMKKLLMKNGVIFLQIPNSDSLAAKILQKKCNMFDGLEHVNLYGVNTIKLLAKRCGLRVLDIQTVIPEIGVINNYLNYEDPYLGNTENKTNIPNLIDENELNIKLLGYKLQVVLGELK
ncbi:SAM-dependent methyltransferase family protein [Desulforapulum autotrophicum HRM2]|uniref:SAM-dependent methyltransferase family protein n=1 Tax=Desulforapulum autotrophicum (strain ATCC 43914 / DSM 3382 / VKM B-1955 / HRM2) TaxID=177437 RepID=C0QA16_DESAH|nr:class I SAM-dependent methyltransferase [Desulforapulum autotrophicum]ACN16734.1 SAM-dependent methyltransferase family protein [Desulforapulum autotrophicum HRM2]